MSLPFPGRVLPPGRGAFRALRHRDFRLLWCGQIVSLTGNWMQSVAQGWLVLRLTDSALYLGLVGFCSYLPVLLFALPAGVAADRLPRRRTLLWTQGAAMGLAAILATLTGFGLVRAWHVAVLAFGLGTVGALDIPVRQSLLMDLVGRDDLPNAIALNSLAFNGARFLGPWIGGAIIAAWGEAAIFGINALSYLGALAAIVALHGTPGGAGRERASWFDEIRDGLAFLAVEPRARVVLALVVVTSLFASPYAVLLPVFARDVFAVGARGLGQMLAATGIGAVVGALLLAGRSGRWGPGRLIGVSLALLGAALVAFAWVRTFGLAVLLLFVIGLAMIVQLATSNTLLQLLAPADLRGRIVSLYMLAFLGMVPIGSLAAGATARLGGAPLAVGAGGAVCLAAALVFALRSAALRAATADPAAPS